MEKEEFLYETLSTLGADAMADQTPSPQPPPPPLPSIESYTVLRNHIPLSTVQSPSLESAAPDYFSLEVMNEAADKETSISATTIPWLQSGQPSTPSSERTLEGNWFRTNSRYKSPMLRLHKEIIDFCNFLSPTPEEQESRTAAIKSVFDVINYIWPNAVAEVFGSFETGLYLPSSDIDVVILGSNVRTPQIGLQALSRALSQRGIAKKMQVIAKARVPIIKFVEKKSGYAFDISFDVHNGPKAAAFIKDSVSKWPPLKPLCLILKVFLQQRELNEVYTGGIGSYALLSMLIAMLRSRQDRQGPPEHNLGILLVNFFDIYGCKLNVSDVGVSCNGEGTFFLKHSKGFSVEGRPSLIAIEDPQAPDNDIGKSSFNYYQSSRLIMNYRAAFMAGSSSSSSSTTVSSSLSSERINQIHMGEGQFQNLTTHKLVGGSNYLTWAQSVKLAINGRGRLGYITGEIQAPASSDPRYGQWSSENSMVISLLINSMDPAIGKAFMFLPTAKGVWEAIKETYSDMEDHSQLYGLHSQMWKMQQGDKDLTEYYNQMVGIWQELDLFEEEAWENPADSVMYKKKVERGRVFVFLAGLNKELDEVRGRILGKRPLPPIREVFSEVRREEGRRRVMLAEKNSNGVDVEGSALVTRSGEGDGRRKIRPFCEHCKKLGHTKDTCWKLHGKPAHL